MVCQYCRKPIGIIRQITDREFCSRQHRLVHSTRSARALREMGEYTYSIADVLTETDEIPVHKPKKETPSGARSAATVLGLAVLAIAGLIVLEKTGMGGGTQPEGPRVESREPSIGQWVGTIVDRLPRGSAPGISIETRFQRGLQSWLPAPGSTAASGWKLENGLVKPGGLRIWNESRNLGDYSFLFEGRVEDKGLGWVVRAPNHRNYYATRLLVPSAGSKQRPEIVRFSVVQGQESRRQHLPIPISLIAGTFYQFEVRAAGDRIVTMIEGRVVDQWRDARYPTGGVGFFNERGDRSSIKWARLNEGQSLTDKLRAYLTFGLIIPMM